MCPTTVVTAHQEEEGRGFRDCTQQVESFTGKSVSITFDHIGMPSLEGYTVACPRTIADCESDGIAWQSEATTLELHYGFIIVTFGNVEVLFQPNV